jgi:predicted nuclease of predicted toxin-antitoxin system
MSDFLVDASLPRAAARVLQTHGHQATDVRDIGMGAASDSEIADYAKSNMLAVISGDTDFGNVQTFLPSDYM